MADGCHFNPDPIQIKCLKKWKIKINTQVQVKAFDSDIHEILHKPTLRAKPPKYSMGNSRGRHFESGHRVEYTFTLMTPSFNFLSLNTISKTHF